METDLNYYKLTHPQKRIWNVHQINDSRMSQSIGGCINIYGEAKIKLIEKAINIIIYKHDGIRAFISVKENTPFQYIRNFKYKSIEFKDFSNSISPLEEFEVWSKGIFSQEFELNERELFDFFIYKINDQKHGVLLRMHHIISDGWSFNIIQNDFCEVYEALINSFKYSLDKTSYIDYIDSENEYLKSNRFERDKYYWLSKFSEIPNNCLYDINSSLNGERKIFTISKTLSCKIRKYVKSNSSSMNSFFLSIVIAYLYKKTDENTVVLGTPVFNRGNYKMKKTVGMFTSTMPLKYKVEPDLKFVDLMHSVTKEIKKCYMHQKYPYDLLIEDLHLSRMNSNNLFKICVNYDNSHYKKKIHEHDVDVVEYYSGHQLYPLQLSIKENKDDNIVLQFDYKIAEYCDMDVQKIYVAIITIIERLMIEETTFVNSISIVSDKYRNDCINNFNNTKKLYPQMRVDELFCEQVARTPDHTAIIFGDKKLTYNELDKRSDRLAGLIQNKMNHKQYVVAVIMDHSFELIICILACLKSGAVFLPIDPKLPKKRIEYILNDSCSKLVLTNRKKINRVSILIEKICLDEVDLLNQTVMVKQTNKSLLDIAYIIYTSGSTGRPKGVMIEHKGLTNYIYWANKAYISRSDDCMALYSSISFDMTLTSIFVPFISGNKLVIYNSEDNDFIFSKIIEDNIANVIKLTPAHLELLNSIDCSNSKVRKLIVGGENLKVSIANTTKKKFSEDLEIYNEYGPTETVVGSMIHRFNSSIDSGYSVPIGVPIANTQIYILNNNLEPVPKGDCGEIYISGEGVARGYLNNFNLTTEKFVTNPFIMNTKMYKTGDRAKFLENNIVEYIGRSDSQIKVNGYRIELREIESYLSEYKGIINTAVK